MSEKAYTRSNNIFTHSDDSGWGWTITIDEDLECIETDSGFRVRKINNE